LPEILDDGPGALETSQDILRIELCGDWVDPILGRCKSDSSLTRPNLDSSHAEWYHSFTDRVVRGDKKIVAGQQSGVTGDARWRVAGDACGRGPRVSAPSGGRVVSAVLTSRAHARCLGVGLAMILGLLSAGVLVGSPANAADGASVPGAVLGPHGSVAGHGAAWWVNYIPWLAISRGGPELNNCATATVNDRRVSVILHGFNNPGSVRVVCRLPAGRPAVLVQPSEFCTTLPGGEDDLAVNLNTSSPMLSGGRRCAQHAFVSAHLKAAAVLDGRTINLAAHQALSPVQTAIVPDKNSFGVPGGISVQVASDGYVLLTHGFPRGVHTLVDSLRQQGKRFVATFVLHVG
jgi:hypothetical protein